MPNYDGGREGKDPTDINRFKKKKKPKNLDAILAKNPGLSAARRATVDDGLGPGVVRKKKRRPYVLKNPGYVQRRALLVNSDT